MKHIAIIGGGPAGIESAASLAQLGYRVSLIEKSAELGGHLSQMFTLFPDGRNAAEVLSELIAHARQKNINVMLNTEVIDAQRNLSGFTITLSNQKTVTADALLIATGFRLFNVARKEEYGYGIYKNVINSLQMEKKLRTGDLTMANGQMPKRVVFLHCVGSRDEKVGNNYCSKVCCVTAVKQAIEIKKMNPEIETFCFYMDIRMFGPYYEELYREAQEKWKVVFVRGKISEAAENIDGRLQIKAEDTLIGKPLRMQCDMLVAMAGMESTADAKFAQTLNVARGVNRFYSSTDNYLRYNNTNVEGVFTAGTCTAPMNIIDTIANARAAALSIHQYFSK